MEDDDRSVVEAAILDDSYWREIKIKADPTTTCSYKLTNSKSNVEKNTFELQISGIENMLIGLYYGDKDGQNVDLKLFNPSDCQE